MKKLDITILQTISAFVIVIATYSESIQIKVDNLFPALKVAIPVAAFIILYRLLFFLYDSFFWRHFHKKDYLGGDWIYKLENHTTGNSLYGIFNITHGLEGVYITQGEVWFSGGRPDDNNKRGNWHSISAVSVDNELHFIFKMKTSATQEKAGPGIEVQGTMLLNIFRENGSPNRLSGHFYDHGERAGMGGIIEATKKTGFNTNSLSLKSFEIYGQSAQQG